MVERAFAARLRKRFEKNDLNTTDLHSYIHPLGVAVPPCWESKTDWDIFRSLAEKTSAMARDHFPHPFEEIVATPLLHDTPDEIAQSEVRDWSKGECEPVPGQTMPHLHVVERDYANLIHRFNSLGPEVRREGIEDHGVHFPVADFYDEFSKLVPSYEWNGTKYPSLVDPLHAANMILHFAPETNGEVAYRGFKAREQEVGLPLADLAEPYRSPARLQHGSFPSWSREIPFRCGLPGDPSISFQSSRARH